jgi:hypothetical protein
MTSTLNYLAQKKLKTKAKKKVEVTTKSIHQNGEVASFGSQGWNN